LFSESVIATYVIEQNMILYIISGSCVWNIHNRVWNTFTAKIPCGWRPLSWPPGKLFFFDFQ
jgi:hypothetical protein